MYNERGWRMLGHKQHLFVAKDCAFSLATLLPNGYLISTVGDYWRNGERVEIGFQRFFETMVFKTKDTLPCGCPKVIDYIELDLRGYNTVIDAETGHFEMCLKWDEKDS